MRAGLKRALVWAVAYALIVQAALAGIAGPVAADAASFDPLAVICHSSGGNAAADQPAGAPAPVCDHCVLCTGTAAAAPDFIIIASLAPLAMLIVLRPSSHDKPRAVVFHHLLPRGPPHSA